MHGLSLQKLNKMRERNYKEVNRNKAITDQRKNPSEELSKENNVKTNLIDIWSDIFINGHMIDCTHGIVMEHSNKSFYYRGQIKDFGTCYSSLFREIHKCSDDEKIRKIFLNQLRINEFDSLINNFTQVKEWYFGDVFTYAIAQHYGFYTDIIDFTNDLDVALFFACCKYDKEKKKYVPLTEENIKSNKYGLLFQRSDFDNTQCFLQNYDKRKFNPRIFPMDYQPFTKSDLFRRFTFINNPCFTGTDPAILPIGYQPFTRCNKQGGYFIHTKYGEDIQSKSNFKIFRFKHSTKLSNELYNKYKGGEKLFNYDVLDEISDLLEIIKTAKKFSNESFENTYMQLHGNLTKEEWIRTLKENEQVTIGETPYNLSKERIDAINKNWSIQKFIENEGLLPWIRKQFYK